MQRERAGFPVWPGCLLGVPCRREDQLYVLKFMFVCCIVAESAVASHGRCHRAVVFDAFDFDEPHGKISQDEMVSDESIACSARF